MKGIGATRQLLSPAAIIIISLALFSGHFGAGDTIFPPALGREAGQSWLPAAMGYGITNSLGVLVAYLAVARQQQTLFQISVRTLGRWFGIVYTAVSMLAVGPVFIMPRISAAAHEMSIAPFFPNCPLWVTLILFFSLNFYVSYNRSRVIDALGKLLSPLLVLFVAVLVVKGIVSPLADPQGSVLPNPLGAGILNGYNTVNALIAGLLGGWVLSDLARRGARGKRSQNENLKVIGLIVAVLLLASSTGLTYLGASTGFAYDAQIGMLTVHIAEGLLGYFGKCVLAVLILVASFTTSVGLSSAAGDVFMEITGGRLKYEVTVGLCSLAGFLLGLYGLSKMIQYAMPWLMLLYPALIVILIGSLFGRYDRVRTAVAAGVVAATIFSLGDFLEGLGMKGNAIILLTQKLPLGPQGLGWIAPALAVTAAAGLLSFFTKKA